MNRTFLFSFVLLVTVCSITGTTQGAECQAEDVATVPKLEEEVGFVAVCGESLVANHPGTSTTRVNPCIDKPCMTAMRALIAKLPSCTVNGRPLRELMGAVLDECPKPPTPSTNLRPSTPTPSSSASATTRPALQHVGGIIGTTIVSYAMASA